MTRFAILGAGTAGLASAIAIARSGHDVEVFERHPGLAPVGAGLLIQPSGIRALADLGVGRSFLDASVPIQRLEGISHKGWRLIDVRYPQPHARAISRHALTRLLEVEARRLGVRLTLGTPVQGVRQRRDAVEVSLPAAVQVFDAAVVASGSGSELGVGCGLSAPSTLYRWAALNAMFPVSGWPGFEILQQRYHGPRKMFGLMPTAREGDTQVLSMFWSLPAADYPRWKETPLAQWRQELLALWPQSEPVVSQLTDHDQFSLATYRHAWPRRLASGRLCLVGDAAHAMSPQLGLGSTLAVGDALALAAALETEARVDDALARYAQVRTRHVRRFQLYSRLLTPCFQADLPAGWRDVAFSLGGRIPGMNRLMLGSLAG